MLGVMSRYLVEVHAVVHEPGEERYDTLLGRLSESGDVLSDPAPQVLQVDADEHVLLQFAIEADTARGADEAAREVVTEALDDLGDVTLVSARDLSIDNATQ